MRRQDVDISAVSWWNVIDRQNRSSTSCTQSAIRPCQCKDKAHLPLNYLETKSFSQFSFVYQIPLGSSEVYWPFLPRPLWTVSTSLSRSPAFFCPLTCIGKNGMRILLSVPAIIICRILLSCFWIVSHLSLSGSLSLALYFHFWSQFQT